MAKPNYSNEASGENTNYRVNNQRQDLLSETKAVSEDIEISLEGDFGTDGRPRVREEIKLPPNYEIIDLNDPNDEVLF